MLVWKEDWNRARGSRGSVALRSSPSCFTASSSIWRVSDAGLKEASPRGSSGDRSGGGRCRRHKAVRSRLVSRVKASRQREALERESGNRLWRMASASDPAAARQESKACKAAVESEQRLSAVLQRTEKVLPQPVLE